MNILFLTTHLNRGGITSYLHTLTKGMIQQGHIVHLVSSGGNRAMDFSRIGAHLKTYDIKTKSELDYRIYKALSPLGHYLKKERINIIHAQTRITQVMGFFLEKQTKCPYVSTCHGFFKPRLSRKIFQCWGRGVIAISQPVKEHLHKDLAVNQEKITLIRSGIDTQKYFLCDDEIKQRHRSEYGLSPQDPVVGIVARLSDVKGQDILICAMRKVLERHPQAKLFLAGQGKTEEELRHIIAKLNMDKEVIIYKDIPDMIKCMSCFDVFVMPSRQEGLGLSILEAQALGLPVIASNVGGIPDIVKEKETGYLFESQNIEMLAEKIDYVLSHRKESCQVGAQARKFVLDQYTSERMIAETLSFYKKFV